MKRIVMVGVIAVIDGRREMIVQMLNNAGGVSVAAIFQPEKNRPYIPEPRKSSENSFDKA